MGNIWFEKKSWLQHFLVHDWRKYFCVFMGNRRRYDINFRLSYPYVVVPQIGIEQSEVLQRLNHSLVMHETSFWEGVRTEDLLKVCKFIDGGEIEELNWFKVHTQDGWSVLKGEIAYQLFEISLLLRYHRLACP